MLVDVYVMVLLEVRRQLWVFSTVWVLGIEHRAPGLLAGTLPKSSKSILTTTACSRWRPGTAVFSQEGITQTKFTLLPETSNEPVKIHESMVSRHWVWEKDDGWSVQLIVQGPEFDFKHHIHKRWKMLSPKVPSFHGESKGSGTQGCLNWGIERREQAAG